MTVSAWSFPTRILFGAGSIGSIGEEARALGASHTLIVSDRGVEAAGLLEPIEASLGAAGVAATRVLDVSSNPTEQEVLDAAAAYRASNSGLVIGVGGGSALDVAKLVKLAVTHPMPLSQYDDANGGAARIVHPMPPMIAVATTAGTGSEVGRSGVVTINGRKTVIFAPALMPDTAILDPQLTQSMPAALTAATGMDALTHCIEAFCSQGDHPMADAVALHGIRLCQRSLRKAVEAPEDLEARGDMLKAAMMGAVAFQKGLGACHSLAHPLSTEFGMHHGLANALCLPAVLDFNRSTIPDRLAEVARVLGVRANDQESLAFECAGAVRSLRKAIGIEAGFAAHGIDETALPQLAALAFQDVCHQLNPRPCTEADMLALYTASYHES